MVLNHPLMEQFGGCTSRYHHLQSTTIEEVQANEATKVFLRNNLGSSHHLLVPSLFNNISKNLRLDRPDDGLHHCLMEDFYCAATYALREIKYRTRILVPGSVAIFIYLMREFLPRNTMRAKQRNS
jgi:hypothetical protein